MLRFTLIENKVKVSLKFSDLSEKYESEYELNKTIYDVRADIINKTGKNVSHIQLSKTQETLDEDYTVAYLKENGYVKSLTAVLQ